MTQNAAVFLDKDGTLIEDVPYNIDPRYIRLMPRAVDGLRALRRQGYALFVVTNQSGVARGYFDEEQIRAAGRHITSTLAGAGVELHGFYFCPHFPEGIVEQYAIACDCRKPETGLILGAAREHDIDLARSWFIGDIASDVEAGRRAGCRTILVADAVHAEHEIRLGARPDAVANDLMDAARTIARLDGARRGRTSKDATAGVPETAATWTG